MELLAALGPSIGLALLFWYVIRAVLHGDRREREELARLAREDDERAASRTELDDREQRLRD